MSLLGQLSGQKSAGLTKTVTSKGDAHISGARGQHNAIEEYRKFVQQLSTKDFQEYSRLNDEEKRKFL